MGLSLNLNSHLGLVATILASVGLDKQLVFAACGLPLPIAYYVWHNGECIQVLCRCCMPKVYEKFQN